MIGLHLKNDLINLSKQKSVILRAPGFLENTGVVTQLIREAHESRGDLAVLWLDLANAYASIPHKLIDLALHLHHVSSKIKSPLGHKHQTGIFLGKE